MDNLSVFIDDYNGDVYCADCVDEAFEPVEQDGYKGVGVDCVVCGKVVIAGDPNRIVFDDELKPVIPHGVYVTIYKRYQCYGGPEEGGWYYHNLVPLYSKKYQSRERALAVAHRHSAMFPTDDYGEGSYSLVEGYPGSFAKTRRQHYE